MYNLVADNPKVKSSYSYIYHEFYDIFNAVAPMAKYRYQENLIVRTNILPDSKNNVSYEVILSTYRLELNEYKFNGYIIFATDASVTEHATGCGVFNVW